MSFKRTLLTLATISTTALLGLTALPSAAAASAPSGDWVSVTKVMVNQLGGVNVSGQVSCAGTYQEIAAGGFQAQDQNGDPVTISLEPGDKVILAANSDNYTVSQPAGRKSMIQVTHASSRMNPCFAQYNYLPDGSQLPSWAACNASGAPCPWQTDEYGYDHDTLPPLFDYSSGGKFKPGTLSVREQSIGLAIMIAHFSGDTLTGWSNYFQPEGSYSTVSTTIKAVTYR